MTMGAGDCRSVSSNPVGRRQAFASSATQVRRYREVKERGQNNSEARENSTATGGIVSMQNADSRAERIDRSQQRASSSHR